MGGNIIRNPDMSGWSMGGSCGGGGGAYPYVSLFSYFNEVSLVPANSETTVSTLVVSATKPLILYGVEFSGNNVAEYSLYIGGTLQGKKWTWFSGPLSGHWDMAGLIIQAGVTVSVKVTHSRPDVGTFNARMIGGYPP